MSRVAPLLLLCLALVAPPAVADTLRVPEDFPTIQAALDAALADDEVLVSKGTYAESIAANLPANVSLRAKGKVFVDASDLGPALTLDGQGLLVEGLRIVGGTDGIVLTGADCLVSRCTVEGVKGRGVSLSGQRNRLDRCTVRFVSGVGIALSAGQGLSITRCVVDATGSTGIAIVNTNVGTVVSRTRISNSGNHGLANNGGGGVVTEVRVDSTIGRGITDGPKANATPNTYLQCRVSWSRAQGFFNINKGPSVQSLTVRYAGDTAMDIRGPNAEVLRCRVRNALRDGLRVAGNGGTYTNNVVTGGQMHGFVLDGQNNKLSRCTGRKNNGFDLRDNKPGQNTLAADNDFGTVWPIPEDDDA